MDTRKFLTLGVVGAVACVGACAAATLIPAMLAAGGLAFVSSEFIGWPLAVGVALLAAAGFLFWRGRARSQLQASCACSAPETTP